MENLKILVVDDEPGIRMGVHRVLDKFVVDYPFMDDAIGFDVIDASTGEEAIEKLSENNFDIVYLDNKLPGIQGIEVLQHINNISPTTKVIMITSYASLELAVQATKIGAFDFVPKPFTPQELRSSVEGVTKQIFLKKMTQKMYKEGKQIRFQFLSLLSHELKSPLNSIEGYLNIMLEHKEGDNIAAYDKMIRRSIDRIKDMRALIFDLLDLTKIESGQASRNIEDIHLNEIMRNSVASIQPMAIQKDIGILVEDSHPVVLKADIRDIEIVMNNLLSNAVKYNKPQGSILCKISDTPTEIMISIADTGIGIGEADIEKLFGEFVRIRNENTRNISGSGLGLAIVKKILNSYDASIHVNSIPGQGSEFIVTFKK